MMIIGAGSDTFKLLMMLLLVVKAESLFDSINSGIVIKLEMLYFKVSGQLHAAGQSRIYCLLPITVNPSSRHTPLEVQYRNILYFIFLN